MSEIIPIITGGGSGIGFGLVKEFLKRGSPKVLITGRRESVLQEAASEYPGKIYFKVSDAGKEQDRVELLEWVKTEHPDCNALVNNAGIQRRIAPVDDKGDWSERETEIEINLSGPIHLCVLFIPYFLETFPGFSLVANVSSGLAFVPFSAGPVYSATKAAIHSYTVAMRLSLTDTNLRLVEIVPPAVKTNLGGSHDFGEDLQEYCEATMERVEAGEVEVGYKFSEQARNADRATLDGMAVTVSDMMHLKKYPAPSSS